MRQKHGIKNWYKKDIGALEGETIDDIRKYIILNILKNLGSIFTGAYLHYKNVPKKQFLKEVSQIE